MRKLAITIILVFGILIAYSWAYGKSSSGGFSSSRSYSSPSPSRSYSPPPSRPSSPPPSTSPKSYSSPPSQSKQLPSEGYTSSKQLSVPPTKGGMPIKEIPSTRTYTQSPFYQPTHTFVYRDSFNPFPSYLLWYYFLFHRDDYNYQRQVNVAKVKEEPKQEEKVTKEEKKDADKPLIKKEADEFCDDDLFTIIGLVVAGLLLIGIGIVVYLLIRWSGRR